MTQQTHHPFVARLKNALESHANARAAIPMRAYMKNKFDFLGIRAPERKALLKVFLKEQGLPAVKDIETITLELWQLPEREYQYLALGLLERTLKKLPPEGMALFEQLIITKSWWDTVDAVASHLVGGLILRYPELRDPWINKWRSADDIWLRRTTLLFQLSYKDKTDTNLLFKLIGENLGSKKFFINKAIGWALREVSKRDDLAVRGFVSATPLEPLSKREALKWLERQALREATHA